MEDSCRVLSSSVIPFAIEPHTQTIYMLLAQAESCSSTGRPHGSWGDLGGTCEPGETSEIAGAREFLEESLCTVCITGDRNVSTRVMQTMLEDTLCEGQYFMRLRLFYITQASNKGDTCQCQRYCRDFYLKETTFDPTVERRFDAARRKMMDNARELGQDRESCAVAPQLLEKVHLQWFSLDHLIDLLAGHGRHRHIHIQRRFMAPLRIFVKSLLQFIPEL